MKRIQMLNKQRAQALSALIDAVKSGSNGKIDKALLFYRVPCYSPNDTGKSDSDVQYDILKVKRMIAHKKSTVMGNALGAAMFKSGKHYLCRVCVELEKVLYLREQYRKLSITAESVYTTCSKASIVESEPVSNPLPITVLELFS
jgi:hypothetical protein